MVAALKEQHMKRTVPLLAIVSLSYYASIRLMRYRAIQESEVAK